MSNKMMRRPCNIYIYIYICGCGELSGDAASEEVAG